MRAALLDTRAAAFMLRLSPGHLTNLRSEGVPGLPFVRLGARAVRYKLSDVLAYIDASTVRSGAAA